MSDTLDELHRHLSTQWGRSARIAVWAHNSHLGDARATEMGNRGELNVGQLIRERRGTQCVLIVLLLIAARSLPLPIGMVRLNTSWYGRR